MDTTDNPHKRIQAVIEIGAVLGESGIGRLVEIIRGSQRDPELMVRYYAAWLLTSMPGDSAYRAMQSLVESGILIQQGDTEIHEGLAIVLTAL